MLHVADGRLDDRSLIDHAVFAHKVTMEHTQQREAHASDLARRGSRPLESPRKSPAKERRRTIRQPYWLPGVGWRNRVDTESGLPRGVSILRRRTRGRADEA